MRRCFVFLLAVTYASTCVAQPAKGQGQDRSREREKAEYYVRVYAQHYGVPLALVRSIVEQESGWHVCTVSAKGAVGLMQLMPDTARRLGVHNRCDMNQNISGGVRYLAWLCRLFQRDYRLVAAAYYAGEQIVAKRGLSYHNPDVVAYVTRVRTLYTKNKNGPFETSALMGTRRP